METFIFEDLNKACRNKDLSRVKTLGPYAWALGKIVNWGYRNKLDSDN
jgi:hypothetical protein